MKILFWLSVIGAGYSYFIYPLILIIFIRIKNKPERPSQVIEDFPTLSLIITAHNEENSIKEKLNNSLKINYPKEKLEIIVASDCSTDNTDKIVKELGNLGINLVRADKRKGKEFAQYLAIQKAKGDILIFSDVATIIPIDAFYTIAEIFNNSKIGAVSSVDQFISQDNKIVGEGLYVRYEMWLRKLESKLAGLVGLSGSFFAARRAVCQNWDILVPSDFNTAMNCIENNYISIIDQRLMGIYKDVKNGSFEYRRKIRTVIRGLTALYRKHMILNPLKYGMFSFQVWGHKIMRWAVPWFLLTMFISNMYIYDIHIVYKSIYLIQIILYALSFIGLLSSGFRKNIIIRLSCYFVLSNYALANATVMFLLGKRITTWNPSKR